MRLNPKEKDQRIKEIVAERLAICNDCPFQSVNAVEKYGMPVDPLPYIHCTFCKCELVAKVHCLKCNCGIEVFNQKYPEREIPLKWKSINPSTLKEES